MPKRMLSSMARTGGTASGSGSRRRRRQQQQPPQQQETGPPGAAAATLASSVNPGAAAGAAASPPPGEAKQLKLKQPSSVARSVMHSSTQIRMDTGRDDYYAVLTPEAAWLSMQKVMDSAAEVLHLPKRYIRMLLKAFRWDKDRLLDRFYESDPEEFLAVHHIPQHLQQQRHHHHQQPHQDQSELGNLCEICCLESAELSSAGCGHRFCPGCWTGYLQEKMSANGQFDGFQCPALNCPTLVDDELLEAHLTDDRLRAQYRRAILASFVSDSRRLALCPGRDCQMVVNLTDDTAGLTSRVTCGCGKSFCFACSQDWHEPITCHMLRQWLVKNEGESMNTQWFLANTKVCPKCHVTIEKDGGCNHMVCRNVNCRYEFCWVCMGEWQPHGNQWYNCNRFDQDRAERLRQEQSVSREVLARYLHYYDLYMNHRRSMELESRLVSVISSKMAEIQQAGLSWVECRFLRDAVDALCTCRRVLMYTYVFAYYLKPNNQQRIFEDNQLNLQLSTEALSEVLEREMDLNNLQQLKQTVQDKYRYCRSRASALLHHVYEGYNREWWSYECLEQWP